MTKNPPRIHPHDVLTPMERAVLFQASTGKTRSQIADALDMSFHTAKHHIQVIRSKLGPDGYRKAVYRNG